MDELYRISFPVVTVAALKFEARVNGHSKYDSTILQNQLHTLKATTKHVGYLLL